MGPVHGERHGTHSVKSVVFRFIYNARAIYKRTSGPRRLSRRCASRHARAGLRTLSHVVNRYIARKTKHTHGAQYATWPPQSSDPGARHAASDPRRPRALLSSGRRRTPIEPRRAMRGRVPRSARGSTPSHGAGTVMPSRAPLHLTTRISRRQTNRTAHTCAPRRRSIERQRIARVRTPLCRLPARPRPPSHRWPAPSSRGACHTTHRRHHKHQRRLATRCLLLWLRLRGRSLRLSGRGGRLLRRRLRLRLRRRGRRRLLRGGRGGGERRAAGRGEHDVLLVAVGE